MDLTPADLVCKQVKISAEKTGFLMIPAQTQDPISLSYLRGETPNFYMLDILNEITYEGDLVIDAGCHIGTFSIAAALLGRRVISIDANSLHASLMEMSKAVNKISSMSVVYRALSTNPDPIKFIQNGVFGMIDFSGENAGAVSVPTIRLDEAASIYSDGRRVRFLKMDIEGAEYDAFLSAERLLQTDCPAIWWESNGPTLALAGKTIAQVRDLLETFGYKTYRVEGDRWVYAPPSQIQPEAWLDMLSLSSADQKRFTHKIDLVWAEEKIAERCQEWTGFRHSHTLRHLIEQISVHDNPAKLAEALEAAKAALVQISDGA